jgi:hypothetical protein
VPTAEEMAQAIIQQETALKIRYYGKLQEQMERIQQQARADQVYGPANNVTRLQGLQPRLDQIAEAQAHGAVRTQFTVGLGMVGVQAFASVGIVTGGVLATAPVAVGSVPAVAEATTGIRVAEEAATQYRIVIESEEAIRHAEALREAQAVQEALEEAEAARKVLQATLP